MKAINFLYACTSEIATINKKKKLEKVCVKKKRTGKCYTQYIKHIVLIILSFSMKIYGTSQKLE